VVRDGVVIGRSGARKDSRKNPIGHAEILAILEAANHMGTADMTGCAMYTNQGSCAMCSATMVANNLSLVVRGIRPAPNEPDVLVQIIDLLGRGQHTKVMSGVLFDETLRQYEEAEKVRLAG